MFSSVLSTKLQEIKNTYTHQIRENANDFNFINDKYATNLKL